MYDTIVPGVRSIARRIKPCRLNQDNFIIIVVVVVLVAVVFIVVVVVVVIVAAAAAISITNASL